MQRLAFGASALAAGPILGSEGPGCNPHSGSSGPAHWSVPLDTDWLFSESDFDPAAMGMDFDDGAFTRVTLPHCVRKLSWQDWDPADWRRVWNYRRHFNLPGELDGLRVYAHFDGVMRGFTPAINGHVLHEHLGGYLPSRFEITDWLVKGDNVLAVAVDGRTHNVPPGAPDGSARIDYMEPAGIHRSVRLEAVPPTYIRDVYAKPVKVLDLDRQVEVSCTLDSIAPPLRPVALRVELRDADRVIARSTETVRLKKIGQTKVELTLSELGEIRLWDIERPHLYQVVVTLLVDGQASHDFRVRIGFREVRFEVDGFFLNGRRLQLFGLNRHELFPYVGFAMPARAMRRDAEILSRDLNCNMVRCSHYPQSPAFLDACDELGVLVWEEVPGWQYIGDDVWKDRLVRDTREMIQRDRNRPSIVIWGTRANESRSDEELYSRTRAVAKSLDDTRPVSGSMHKATRRNWESEWNEDVFAFDDYQGDAEGRVAIWDPVPNFPYMLAEAVGQFNYTTGLKFDSYYRRSGPVSSQMLQALRHAQAHSQAGRSPRYCGVIAWCGFEYGSLVNHHRGVKYPGVVDTFRIPKLGATFYLAQGDPAVRAVIEPNFYWDFGQQTPRGPGKGAAIFSNCDRLEVFVDEKWLGAFLPDVESYPHLAHAPFLVDLDIDGSAMPELRVDGYVKDRLVLSRSFSSDTGQDRLSLSSDDEEILGDGIDATRLSFRVVDKYGAQRPLAEGDVSFKLTGPGAIVGDNPFNLSESGGAGAVWIKSLPNQTGRITLKVAHSSLDGGQVEIHCTAPAGKSM